MSKSSIRILKIVIFIVVLFFLASSLIYEPIIEQSDKEEFDTVILLHKLGRTSLSIMMLPGPDDGVVTVERAKVDGMTDFLILPHSHTFIMQKNDVIEQVIYFLKHGEFRKENNA